MKSPFALLVSAFLLLPFNLFGQASRIPDNKCFTLMRCSDLEEIEMSHSFGYHNLDSKVSTITPDGEYFIVGSSETTDFGPNYTYSYYNSGTGQLIKTETDKSNLCFAFVDNMLLSYGRDITVEGWPKFETLWHFKRFKDTPFYIHNGILLAMGAARERFYGYDLTTGKELWEVKISHDGGISDVYSMDDDHVLLVADDLVKINTKTGKKKSLDIKTSILNGKQLTAQILVGVASAVSIAAVASAGGGTFYYFVPNGGKRQHTSNGMLYTINGSPNAITKLSSNILQGGDLYYLADRDSVRCFDENLNIQWATKLISGYGSHSYLRLSGDTLWMVNYGIATFRSIEQSNTGRPFVAAFNARTGEQLLLKKVGKRHAPVKQVKCYEDRVVYYFGDSCKTVYFDQPNEIQTFISANIKNSSLLDGDVYVLDSKTHRFNHLEETNTYLQNADGDICQVAHGLSDVATHSYVYYLRGVFVDSLYVVCGGPKGTDCWMLNEQGEPVFHVLQPVEDVAVREKNIFLFNNFRFAILNKDLLKPSSSVEKQ